MARSRSASCVWAAPRLRRATLNSKRLTRRSPWISCSLPVAASYASIDFSSRESSARISSSTCWASARFDSICPGSATAGTAPREAAISPMRTSGACLLHHRLLDLLRAEEPDRRTGRGRHVTEPHPNNPSGWSQPVKVPKLRRKSRKFCTCGSVSPLLRRLRALVGPFSAVLLAGASLTLLAPAETRADQSSRLRAERDALASEERAAVIQLYSLDGALERSRSELGDLRARRSRLGRDQAEASLRLRVPRRTLAAAQRDLGGELRSLYEQSQPDALAVILGATSLNEALDEVAGLHRAAAATSAVVEQARSARSEVAALSRSLARRSVELRRLESAASAKQAELVQARAERSAYVDRLEAGQRLRSEQIASLEQRARAAEAAARAANARAAATASTSSFVARVAASAPASKPAPPEPTAAPATTAEATTAPATTAPTEAPVVLAPEASAAGARTMVVVSTGYALPGTTATGLPVGPGVVGVDPSVIPLGTRMTIPGYGEGVAADTGGAIVGNRIDLWFPTEREAEQWGWQTLTITLH